jgi:hypothetical protein
MFAAQALAHWRSWKKKSRGKVFALNKKHFHTEFFHRLLALSARVLSGVNLSRP